MRTRRGLAGLLAAAAAMIIAIPLILDRGASETHGTHLTANRTGEPSHCGRTCCAWHVASGRANPVLRRPGHRVARIQHPANAAWGMGHVTVCPADRLRTASARDAIPGRPITGDPVSSPGGLIIRRATNV